MLTEKEIQDYLDSILDDNDLGIKRAFEIVFKQGVQWALEQMKQKPKTRQILELEFWFFCEVEWREVKCRIQADNSFQLIRCYLGVARTMRGNKKVKWQQLKDEIEIIQFPNIEKTKNR